MVEWDGASGIVQVVVAFIFLGLACVVLSLRLFTRVVVSRNHGPEDWVIAAAFCFSITQTALVLVEFQNGQGLPQSKLSETDLVHLRKALYKAIPTYLASLTLTKLSILLQYMRIFKDKNMHRIIIGMLVFVATYGLWSILGSLFLCTPVHFFWDRMGDAKCMNFKAKWFTDAAVNIVTDLILLGMPMPFLKDLNLPRRQKSGLIAVFALGGFVCLVSIARLGPLFVVASNSDVSKHNGGAAILSSMEVNVGIICASLPSLRAITLRTCSRRSTSSSPSARTNTHHTNRWWRFFNKQNDNIELEQGRRGRNHHHHQIKEENLSFKNSENTITKIVSIKMDTQERRDSAGRKASIWSIPYGGGGGGGIFDGGPAKAYIRSDIN